MQWNVISFSENNCNNYTVLNQQPCQIQHQEKIKCALNIKLDEQKKLKIDSEESHFNIFEIQGQNFKEEKVTHVKVDYECIITWLNYRILLYKSVKSVRLILNKCKSLFLEAQQKIIEQQYEYIRFRGLLYKQNQLVEIELSNSICIKQNDYNIFVLVKKADDPTKSTLELSCTEQFKKFVSTSSSTSEGTTDQKHLFNIDEFTCVKFYQDNAILLIFDGEIGVKPIKPFYSLFTQMQREMHVKAQNKSFRSLVPFQMSDEEQLLLKDALDQKMVDLTSPSDLIQIDPVVAPLPPKQSNIPLEDVNEDAVDITLSLHDVTQDLVIESKQSQETVNLSESKKKPKQKEKKTFPPELPTSFVIKEPELIVFSPEQLSELDTTQNALFCVQNTIQDNANILSLFTQQDEETVLAVVNPILHGPYINPLIVFGIFHSVQITNTKSVSSRFKSKHVQIQFALYSDLKMKNMKPSAKPKICEEMQLLKAIEISMASINRMQLFVTQATVQKHFKLIEKVHGWEHVHKWSDLNFNYKVWSLEDLAGFIFLDQE
ncbi:Hypothetical_protein [Hexamita inflata]|uniref:Hypothetical_protein n=1 Tax=Hexamita inflata TaxID=28002 RepID=A0AA86U0E1_9EUKA|nr:Hypothetical protein HINF_LOCUS23129 [Hexamita inflata]